MTPRSDRLGLVLTGNLLVFWTLTLPALWLGDVLPGANTLGLVAVFFLPWVVGVLVLGVLYVVQR